MTRVLIADHCKPSLVMSSEVFKDKIPGAEVIVAATGAEALQLVVEKEPDICLIDFDMPDADGAHLITALRKIYQGPILMTAFNDNVVDQAIKDMLFAYNDASSFIAKPVRFDVLAKQIERFLIDGRRLGRRFDAELHTRVIGKAEGRGKRAPKVEGFLVNLSLGGACIQLDDRFKVKKEEEVTIAISFPMPKKKAQTTAKKKAKKVTKKKVTVSKVKEKVTETKFKATLCWSTKDQIGVKFGRLTEIQRKGLESYLKATGIM